MSITKPGHYEAQVDSWVRRLEKQGVRFAVDSNGNVWALIAEHAETIAGIVGAR